MVLDQERYPVAAIMTTQGGVKQRFVLKSLALGLPASWRGVQELASAVLEAEVATKDEITEDVHNAVR
ncbi:MAG: hypothetical protein HUU55_16575 [Myxococcales bacterium]|nr:hypothetical protein [Myxococcales bacterium]